MRNILLLVAFLPICSWAQPLGIEEYRQSVVEYSYTLKNASAKVDYAYQTYLAKQTASLPSLTLSGDFTQQFRLIKGQENWNFSLQPQLSQTIYAGGGVRAQRAKAEMGVDVAELNASQDLLDVKYTADYHYYNLVSMEAYCDAVERYVEIITSLKEVVELRYNEGYIAKSDLLMIETRLSEALYEQIAIKEDYTIALQKFNILRGVDAEVAVELQNIDINRVTLPSRTSLEELLMRRPDFLASTLAVDQAASEVAITRAAYNPSVSVGVMGSWQPNIPNINGSTVMNGAVFVKLSAPLFHFGERGRTVAAAQALRNSSELTTMVLVDDIRLEESNMWATIVDSQAQRAAAQRALMIGSENLEISTFSYSEGLTTILDVMQAQISWLQLYTNSIWSEFNFLVSISAYRRITASE